MNIDKLIVNCVVDNHTVETSIIADQLADNIQDLGKLEIAHDQIKDIETAKSMIYRASRALSMVAEDLKED